MGEVRLFLCGDVMTGRGIDQVLPYPSDPTLYEPYVTSAVEYVEMAERAHGPIPWPVPFSYVWGDALEELQRRSPDARICNLETSITMSDQAEPKGINYRMHPGNVACLTAAGLDCCVLSNNHVLDWGTGGLLETLDTLHAAGVATAGAGRDAAEADRPASLPVEGRRVLIFGMGLPTSGIRGSWAAGAESPGIRLLPDLSDGTADAVSSHIGDVRRDGDVVVASIHWGGNWGYEIPAEQRRFARRLVEAGNVDVVHGHSSHHPKGIECLQGRPILYGCGDFVNDYEGIGGYEEFRPDLVLAYFVTMDAANRLSRLEMVPFRTVRFRLERPGERDGEWMRERLDSLCEPLGSRVLAVRGGSFALDLVPG